jgi:hypothetical protein
LDDLCRDLILSCRGIFDKLSKEKLFYLDMTNTIPFRDFIDNQKNINQYLKNIIEKSILDVVQILCSRCEDYIFEAAAVCPPSITSRQYESMKIGQSVQISQLMEAVNNDNSITSKVLKVMEEVKTQQSKGTKSSKEDSLREAEGANKRKEGSKQSKEKKPLSRLNKTLLQVDKIKQADVKELLMEDLNQGSSVLVESEEDDGEVLEMKDKNKKKLIQKITKMKDERDDHKEILTAKEIFEELSLGSTINIPYSIRAAVRLRCRKLLPLFRLIDYMIRDKLYDFLNQSLVSFYKSLTEANYATLKKGFGHRNNNDYDVLSLGKLSTPPTGTESIEDTKLGILKLDVVLVPSSKQVEVTDVEDTSATLKESEPQTKNRTNSHDLEVAHASSFVNNSNTVVYYMEEISLEPNKVTCLEDIRMILAQICAACSYVQSLLSYDRCARLFAPIKSELTTTLTTIDDRIFVDNDQNHIQRIIKFILSYFNNCFDYILNKEITYNSFYLEEFNKNAEIYVNSMNNRLLSVPPESILSYLNKWKGETEYLIENLKVYRNYYSVFHLEYKNIKLHFQSILTSNQELFYRLIPDIYVTNGDKFYREISYLIDKLQKKFTNLDEFVTVVENYNSSQDQVDDMSSKFKYVMSIREIVETNSDHIRISDAILRQNLTLTNTFHKFQTILQEFPESIFEENVKVYRHEILSRYKKITLPIESFQNYINEINSFMINDSYQPNAEEILTTLFNYKKEIENITKLLTTLDYYQNLLKLTIFEKGLELEVDESLKANIILWSSYKTLNELMNKFMQISYLDCNCDNLIKEVNIIKSELNGNNYLTKINETINQNMSTTTEEGQANLTLDSEVSTALRGIYKCYHIILSISATLLEYIPLIKKLQSNTFKTEHIAEIHTTLQHNIYDDVDITVGELIDVVKIKEFAVEIDHIYNQSKIQFHLEYKVNTVIKFFQNIEFQFSNDADNKALIFISNFENIFELVNDCLLTFQSIKQSASVHTIESVVVESIRDLSTWITLLKSFQYFQVKYLQYRTLFTSAKTARQLAPYMKYFKTIDENWRTLIRLSKLALTVSKFFEERTISSILMGVSSNITQIEKGIKEIIEDQCEKYPKLYLVDFNTMIELFTNNNLLFILQLVSLHCFSYSITNMEVDQHEAFNILSVYSHEEKMHFHKFISGRSNLADFCRSLENMINDRLERDIKELIFDDLSMNNPNNPANPNNPTSNLLFGGNATSGTAGSSGKQILDDLKTGKYCEQSQILMFQVKFWSIADKILSPLPNYRSHAILSPNQLLQQSQQQQQQLSQVMIDEEQEEIKRSVFYNLRSFYLELTDQISMVTSVLTDTTNSFMMKRVSNLILLVVYYRDLVKSMMEDELNQLPEKLAEGGNDFQTNEQQSYFVDVDKAFYSCQKRVILNNHLHNFHLYSNNTHLANDSLPQSINPLNPTVMAGSVYNGPVISVELGGFMERYGMKYQGFHSRLVILPIVDRCFFALNQAFRMKHYDNTSASPFQAPILTAQYPKSIIQGLAYEHGSDLLLLDGNLFTLSRNKSVELLIKSVIVAFRCNHVVYAINHAEKWTMETLSYFGNLLNMIYQTVFIQKQEMKIPMENKTITLSPASFFPGFVSGTEQPAPEPPPTAKPLIKAPSVRGQQQQQQSSSLGIPSTSISVLPKFCFLHSVTMPNKFQELFQTNHLFVPVNTPFIPTQILLKTLLSSYNFVYVNKITQRIEGVIDYFISSHIITSRSHLLKLFVKAIRLVGIQNEHSKINVAMQLNLLVKKFFSLLPISVQLRLTEYEIRLLCNLFLEVIYNHEADYKDFYSSFIKSIEYHLTLKKMILASFPLKLKKELLYYSSSSASSSLPEDKDETMDHSHAVVDRNIITVIGAVNMGKTTLIRNTLQQIDVGLKKYYGITTGENETGASTKLMNKQHLTDQERSQEQSLIIYPHVINPMLLINIYDSTAFSDGNASISTHSSATHHTVLTQFQSTIQKLIEKQLTSVYQPSNIHFMFHFDFPNSLYLSYLLESTNQFLNTFYFHRKTKLICELTELSDLSPQLLTTINILYLHERTFTLEELIAFHYKHFTEG